MNIVYELRMRSGMKQKELAAAVGVSSPTVSEWEHGKKDPTGERLYKLAQIFKVDQSVILGYKIGEYTVEASKGARRIPVLGAVPAGIPIEAITDIIDWEEIPEEWEKGNKSFFALEVHGNSMYPRYENGDIIIVRVQEDCESGDDCIVMVNGNDATFKRVRKTEKGIILQAINPEFESYTYTNEEVIELPVTICGVVVELRRKMRRG